MTTQAFAHEQHRIPDTVRPTPTAYGLRFHGLRSHRSGMTIVELLVSATIIVMMLLIVGTILSTAQKTVSSAEAMFRANAKVAAMRTVIREDLRRAAKSGFICLTQAPDGSPRLIFTTAGHADSLTELNYGSGTFAVIGTVPSDTGDVVYRQAMMLNWTSQTPDWAAATLDRGVEDYGSFQIRRRDPNTPIVPGAHPDTINEFINYVVPSTTGQPNRIGLLTATTPPLNVDAVQSGAFGDYFWKLLCTKASRLSIMWTDGTVDDSAADASNRPLKWCGVSWSRTGNKYVVTPRDSNWDKCNSGNWFADAAGNNCFLLEFADGLLGDNSTPCYRALWTKEYPQAVYKANGDMIRPGWPVAFKIRFTIQDDYVPDAEYEIICPVGG